MRTKNLFLVLCLGILAAGCSTNPVTGKSELSLVSEQQEIALGQQQYAPSQQSQGGQYLIDPSLQDYVNGIGQRLAAVSHRPDLPYEFVVLNNSVPNAWALPGGKIAINRGLLIELEDEAELAAVIGHEIVHAAARHGASQMSRGQLTNLTAGIAAIAAASAGYGGLGQAAQLGSAAFMARYGRDDELEADKYGMDYMAALGYDPQAAVSLQETFVRLSEGRQQDFVSGLFASHPPSMARVVANREHAKSLPSGQRFKQRYQQMIAQLRKDEPAYQKLTEAQKALADNKPDQALALMSEATSIQPDEGLFWETRGHAWRQKDNLSNAEKAYSTAIRKSPGYFSPLLYRGIVRFESNKNNLAREDLLASQQLLPNGVVSYYLGRTYAEDGDIDTALRYLEQAAGSGGEVASAAQYQMAVLDLARNPNRYIASQTYLGNDGYLKLAIQNNTPATVGGVAISVVQLSNRYTVAQEVKIKQMYQLEPGQRIDVNTGVGPLASSAEARQWRGNITSARVIQSK